MQQITSEQIRKVVRAVWPNIGFIWLADTIYLRPPIATIEGLLVASKVHDLKFNGELMDCDDYALQANAFVKRNRIELSDTLPMDENYHLAFGEAFGPMVRGLETPHTLNICVAEEGVFLVEPQTYEYWHPQQGLDEILLMKM